MINIIQGHKFKSIIVFIGCYFSSFASNTFSIKKIMDEIELEKKEDERRKKRIQAEIAGIVAQIKKEVKEEFQKEKKLKAEQEIENARLAAVALAAQAEEQARIAARTVTLQDRQFIKEWIVKNAKKYKA